MLLLKISDVRQYLNDYRYLDNRYIHKLDTRHIFTSNTKTNTICTLNLFEWMNMKIVDIANSNKVGWSWYNTGFGSGEL